MILCAGEHYEGGWDGAKPNGSGTMKEADGSQYDGEYVHGKKQGQGKMRWNNGDTYEGGWKNDKVTTQHNTNYPKRIWLK